MNAVNLMLFAVLAILNIVAIIGGAGFKVLSVSIGFLVTLYLGGVGLEFITKRGLRKLMEDGLIPTRRSLVDKGYLPE